MKSLIAWFVDNEIAAHLLMAVVIFGGISTIPVIEKEFFPQRELNLVVVSMVYPGAGPVEIEEQVCRRIEEAIDGLDGIEEVLSVATEGFGEVRITVEADYDISVVLNEVKSRVDSITTFPAEVELPRVSQVPWASRVVSLGIAGEIDLASLKELTLKMRDDLLELPSVQKVTVNPELNYEVAIEVSETALRRYGLSFNDVANAVRGKSLNLPAGKLRSPDGDVQLQARGQAYTEHDFKDIVVMSDADGGKILLGDVAQVVDGFEEVDVISRLNGKPALTMEVFTTTNPNIMRVSREVLGYLEELQQELPPGVEVATWANMNHSFEGRLRTLFSNGLGGLALVFLLLFFFLRPLLAMWVAVGIAIAFLGAVWMLPLAGISFNIISLFAFILILGIVVDDAIVVGESIYTHQQRDRSHASIVRGATSVMSPVTMGVVTTMIIFGGFLFMSDDSPEPKNLGTVVLIALAFSLIESFLVLPSHLANMPPEKPPRGPLSRLIVRMRKAAARGMHVACHHFYSPFVERALNRAGLTVLVFLVIWMVPFSYYAGGWMRSSFFPQVEGSYIFAKVEMPPGTPFGEMRRLVDHIEDAAGRLRADLPEYIGLVNSVVKSENIEVLLELTNTERIPYSNREVKDRWLGHIGEIPGAREMNISTTIFSRGKPISLLVKADTLEALRYASEVLGEEFAKYGQVFNIGSDIDTPRLEVALQLKPQADLLGITLSDVAREVRRGFYGEEAQRIPRVREDVRVLVRYPRQDRAYVDSLQDMRIRTAQGLEAPFEEVAEITYTENYRRIERIDGKRKMEFGAELPFGVAPGSVIEPALAAALPVMQARYPDLSVELAGEEEDNQEFQTTLRNLMLTVVIIIYGLIAVVFRSWWQPVLIISAIPFGIVGAIFGHVLIGREVSMFSLMGVFACAGVVINDNLVLVDRINHLRANGVELREALVQGVRDRFRAVVLTSLTTFIGLTPIMFQSSVQAQFLVPMVVSLAFGVLFATFVTLLFVPSLYMFGEQLRLKFARGEPAQGQSAATSGSG